MTATRWWAGAALLVAGLVAGAVALTGGVHHPGEAPAALPLPLATRHGAVADRGPAADVAAVKTQAVGDLVADTAAQRLPTDRAARLRVARAEQADALRTYGPDAARAVRAGARPTPLRLALTGAWAPSVRGSRVLSTAAAVAATAPDALTASIVDNRFTVSRWQGVRVAADDATALLIGFPSLHFAGAGVATGWVDDHPEQWQLALHRTAGRWQLVSLTSAA